MSAAIEVRDLVKVFKGPGGGARAVDGVSFSARFGEIFGVLGPNGAGKTTTLRILSTTLRPTSGAASIHGFDIARQPNEVRRRIWRGRGVRRGGTDLVGRIR